MVGNGWVKIAAFLFAIGGIIWAGGSWKSDMSAQVEMIKYKHDNMEKNILKELAGIDGRLIKIETRVDILEKLRLDKGK